jgi:hypothetical protein
MPRTANRPAGLTTKDRIDVALNEYRTLREEILKLVDSYDRFVLLFATILGAIMVGAYQGHVQTLVVLVPLATLAILAEEARRHYFIMYLNRYVGVLERRINRWTGRDALNWESSTSVGRLPLKWTLSDPGQRPVVRNPQPLFGLLVVLPAVPVFAWALYHGALALPELFGVADEPLRTAVSILYAAGCLGLLAVLAWARLILTGRVLDRMQESWQARWREAVDKT